VTTALNATYQKVVTLGHGLLFTAIATGLLLGWFFGQIGWPLLLDITESSGKIDWIATVVLGKLPSIILLTILILRMTFLRASTTNEFNVQPSGVDTITAAAWIAIKVWVAHIAAFLIALRFGLEINDIGNGSASFEAIIHDVANRRLFETGKSRIFFAPFHHAIGGIHMADASSGRRRRAGCGTGVTEEIEHVHFATRRHGFFNLLTKPFPIDRLLREKPGVLETGWLNFEF
jgi:hypothetical protein